MMRYPTPHSPSGAVQRTGTFFIWELYSFSTRPRESPKSHTCSSSNRVYHKGSTKPYGNEDHLHVVFLTTLNFKKKVPGR